MAGYEATGRLGMIIGRALIERGAHPTATLGVFGAAAAAGQLAGLDDAQLGHAFGIAGSMAAGTMAFTEDPHGTMVKRLFGGLPAERGVLAVELARRGLTGPRGAIDGRYGVAAVLADTAFDVPLAAAPGGYVVGDTSVKLYACCKNFHALIDAIAEVPARGLRRARGRAHRRLRAARDDRPAPRVAPGLDAWPRSTACPS